MVATSMVPLLDELAFVVAGGHRAGAAELVEGPLDGVAPFVGLAVEGWWPPTEAGPAQATGDLVGRLGDRGRDPPAAQGRSNPAGRIRLIRHDPCRPGSRSPTAGPQDAHVVHHGGERQRIVALTGRRYPGHRSAPGVGGTMNFGAESATGTTQCLRDVDRNDRVSLRDCDAVASASQVGQGMLYLVAEYLFGRQPEEQRVNGSGRTTGRCGPGGSTAAGPRSNCKQSLRSGR